MLNKLLGDRPHLFQGARTLHGQALLLIAAMRARDFAILLGMVRVAQVHREAEAVTEARALPKENRCLAGCSQNGDPDQR